MTCPPSLLPSRCPLPDGDPCFYQGCLHTRGLGDVAGLTDAYFHVPISPSDWKWLRFVWLDQIFSSGLCQLAFPGPGSYVGCPRARQALRAQGIRLRMYLDDWLVLAQSEALCREQVQILLTSIRQFGFRTNLENSDLESSQRFVYLGIVFDTVASPCPLPRGEWTGFLPVHPDSGPL